MNTMSANHKDAEHTHFLLGLGLGIMGGSTFGFVLALWLIVNLSNCLK